ncbi:MAG TPA: Uma2 family endonuclease, partial [Kofleriaceae bacterium]|nr:Uma2 family endonuclease [Kofleriaceae bacterium]
MPPVAIARLSYAEYLVFEAASHTKHEYLNGEIFAMASGSIAHGALTAAIGAALSNALRDQPCRVLTSDVRVRSKATGLATYPDVTVVRRSRNSTTARSPSASAVAAKQARARSKAMT